LKPINETGKKRVVTREVDTDVRIIYRSNRFAQSFKCNVWLLFAFSFTMLVEGLIFVVTFRVQCENSLYLDVHYMWYVICLFVALNRRVGTLEISIITINAIEQVFVIHARWILPRELGGG